MQAQAVPPSVKPIEFAAIQAAHHRLKQVIVEPLVADDWRRATCDPWDDKRLGDGMSIGTSWCWRHAHRNFAGGRPARGTLCALAIPFTTVALCASTAAFGMGPIVLGAVMSPSVGGHKRSEAGVREDKVGRAVDALRLALEDAMQKVKFGLRTGEVESAQVQQIVQEVRGVSCQARKVCKRWPGEQHGPIFAHSLDYLDHSTDLLGKKIPP